MSEILLSVFDVARMLNKSPSMVRIYEGRGDLRAMKTRDGTRIFKQRDVEKFLERRAKDSSEPITAT